MAERHPTDPLADALRRRYGEAYQRTLERLAAALKKQGRSGTYYQAWLRQIERELAQLREESRQWAAGKPGHPGAVEEAWRAGLESAMRDLARAGAQIDSSFALPHRDAIRVAVANADANLAEALAGALGQSRAWINIAGALALADTTGGDLQAPLIGRRVRDELRRIGLDATTRKLTEGLTVRDMRKILIDDLMAAGITSIRDQAGRRWSLEAYAGMVARTTTREAYTAGAVQAIQGHGHDLVRISEHWPTCPICATRQGRVISLSGQTSGWPTAAEVGLPPYHPACGHSVAPVVVELLDDAELAQLREASNRPLDDDPRSRHEKEAYDRSQRINTLRRGKRQLLAQRATGEVPLDADMRRWAAELKQPNLDPARRRELERMLGDRADRIEQRRRQRLEDINTEIKALAGTQRQALIAEHRRLMQAQRFPPIGGGGGSRKRSRGSPGTSDPEAHRVAQDLATVNRRATPREIRALRQHVAAAGFDPNTLERAGGRAAGVLWRGRRVQGIDMLPPLEVKYLRHVLGRPEWPPGTTIKAFQRSIEKTVKSVNAGVFVSRYDGELQIGFVNRSGRWQGPSGRDWLLVEYRVSRGHIVTTYQPPSLEDIEKQPLRSDMRWLRRPK